MEGLKWIKLATGLFNNRKIKQIESLPEGDTILAIWFKLLCLAGTINDAGLIYITKKMPYTVETLAEELRRPIKTVRMALTTFENFDMVAVAGDGILQIVGWAEHQGGAAVPETAAEKNRLRQQRYRDRQKMLPAGQTETAENVTENNESNVTRNVTNNDNDNVTVTLRNAPRIRIRNREREERDLSYTTESKLQEGAVDNFVDNSAHPVDNIEKEKWDEAVSIFNNTVRPVKSITEAERIRDMVADFGMDAYKQALEIVKKKRPKVPLAYMEEVLKNRDGPGGNDPVAGVEAANKILESGEILDFNSQ